MNHMNPEILEIAIRHLQGKATQPEEKQLAAWLEAAPQNKASFQEVVEMWRKTATREIAFQPDVRSAWTKVKKQTIDDSAQTKLPGKQVFMSWGIVKVAAAVLMLFGIGFVLLWFGKTEENWKTIVSANEVMEVRLPDSSTVWLNRNSRLSWSDFSGRTRLLKLEGEAFFEVKRNPEQPFRVEAKESITQVLGTSFNLKSTATGHDEVELVSGSVSFSAKSDATAAIKIKPGQRATITNGGNAKATAIENPNFRSWQTGMLRFENAPIADVCNAMTSYFGVPVKLADSVSSTCRFTGSFQKPDLNQMLNVVALSTNHSIQQNGNSFLLSGKGCP